MVTPLLFLPSAPEPPRGLMSWMTLRAVAVCQSSAVKWGGDASTDLGADADAEADAKADAPFKADLVKSGAVAQGADRALTHRGTKALD